MTHQDQPPQPDPTVAILMPVYNEATVVGDVIRSLLAHFAYVVAVDDGSSDASAERIEAAGGILVQHPVNLGQGAALQTAIEFGRRLPVDYFCTFDADGQHRISDVLQMLEVIRRGDVDIVLGSRFLGTAPNIGRFKKMMLRLAVLFSNMTTGLHLTDTHNGLRVFNRTVASGMEITMPDMSHASEIVEIVARQRFRYAEVPTTIEYTEYSKSKGQSMVNAVNIAFDALLRKFLR